MGNLFITLKHLPYDVLEDHKFKAKEEDNGPEPHLEFL
jgi:hypothetical protein